jgi:hypothetical protein
MYNPLNLVRLEQWRGAFLPEIPYGSRRLLEARFRYT